MIKDIKKYIERFFLETKEKHQNIDNNVLKSCLVYQYLYHKHFNKLLTIDEILEINNNDIGLIGPNSGRLTWLLESTLGRFQVFHTHSILHDAFGRFYLNYQLDRGYLYAIPEDKTNQYFRSFPLCGQISGLIYCIHRKLII